jgi:hypothetical protein
VPDPDPSEEVRAALDEIDRIYERVAASIAAADHAAAFEAASEFAAKLRALGDRAAQLRLESVGRIWDTDKLSLAGLADRIGVSKSRADSLIRAVKKLHEEATDDHGDDEPGR